MRAGCAGIVLDLRPQPLHVHVERLGVAVVVRTPDPVDEHVAGEHATGVRQQQLEQLELLERERDALAAHGDLVTSGVEAHVADLEDLVGLRDAGVVAATAASAARTRATSSRRRNGLVT